ncbi:unnamed protein product [Schistosoma margrebowiei]|uniref:Uncharacterized protein n=1 Tax=Schistosoma margrebowiei TaxID=48269 RepID=A0A183LA11_9TREM|nr:unnamed protein product [Schistosoma margrebowiei]
MPESGDSEQVVRCSDGRNEVEDQSEHATAENGEVVVVNTETPVEEEPKSYTLEEYKAMRQSSKPAVLLNNKGLRKANDGKDVFANMVAHRKIQEVHEDTYEVEEKENEPEIRYRSISRSTLIFLSLTTLEVVEEVDEDLKAEGSIVGVVLHAVRDQEVNVEVEEEVR